MSKDREPLDMIHDATQTVRGCADSLASIARALRRVGMSELADAIGLVAHDLRVAKDDVLRGYTLDLNRNVRARREEVGNTLALLLVETPDT